MAELKPRYYGFHALRKDRDICLLTDAAGKNYVRRNGKVLETHLKFLGRTAVMLAVGQERYFFCVEKAPEGLRLVHRGDLCWIKEQATEAPRLFAELFGQPKMVLKSQMPGLVTAIHVKANQYVKEGQTLMVIEAMKMQNPIKAPACGKIKKVFVSTGMSVEGGIYLVEMERMRS